MIKFKFLYIFIVMAACLYSCDDSTPDISDNIFPNGDKIEAKSAVFNVSTNSILVDSVYARTSTAYLGRYTDPVFGEFTADFLAQFNCNDDFEFPEHLEEVTSLKLFLQYSSFYGDSLAPMTLQVDTLNKIIPENSKANFYTSIDPSEYYNKNVAPIATKGYSAGGASVDTIFTSNNVKTYTQSVALPLSLGKYMYQKYVEDKNNYSNAEAFIKNVLKGIYVSNTSGDGSVLYIDNIDLRIVFDYKVESSSGQVDSLVTGYSDFAATKEVIQANRFQNSAKLKELASSTDETYIKTPAGILTEATLPIEDIYTALPKDTLNAASISFQRYNDTQLGDKYPMGVPTYLLMLRKQDLYTFFENNKVPDSETSFLATYGGTNATANTYTFTNIARLLSYCINEKNEGIKENPNWLTENPDWNKVVLVPVDVTTESSSVTKVSNSLSMQSIRLVGGEKDPLKLQIIYTNFGN